jgi:Type IV secretion-system coupling protein DNA-binding domain
MRAMQFPRRFPWLIALVLLPFSGVLFLPLALWYWLSYPPVQHYYLEPYFESAFVGTFEGDHSTVAVPVHWLYKTAPGKKRELAMVADVVSDSAGNDLHLPMKLSPIARGEGWTGLVLGPSEAIAAARLKPYLQETFFDRESAWRLFLQPVLWGAAAVIFLLAGWITLRERLRHEERHGRRTKGPELLAASRSTYRAKADGIRFCLRFENPLLGRLPFGPGYRIPRKLESSHILLMGDTGSGKSTAIRQILRQVQERGESAIVYDPAMDFVGEFYDPKRGDLILNPLDARCPYWNLGAELMREETATTIAAAFLPETEYEREFFTDGPRRILAHLLKRKPQPRDLLEWMAAPGKMAEMVKGTPLAALLDPAAPPQRAGVIASMNMVADSLESLPEYDDAQDKTFSTAEWYTERKRWVFLTSSAEYREKLLPLHSVWLDLFILRMMGHCESSDAKPVWFVLDELASLNKLPQLHTAVTESRKYGNPVVLGFQGRSQLEKRYGQDAEAMLSQPATKIFFKTSEPRAAKWISEAIGEIEVERLKESRNLGLLGSKKSYAMEIAIKPLVMASEISGLESLRGFIKQENRVVPVWFQLTTKCNKQPEFIERKMPAFPRKPVETTLPSTKRPVLSTAPEKPARSLLASQAALPFDAPAGSGDKDRGTDRETEKRENVACQAKEGFVWHTSKGID